MLRESGASNEPSGFTLMEQLVIIDGHHSFVPRSEFLQPGGPSVPIQVDSKQNWWREGATQLVTGPSDD